MTEVSTKSKCLVYLQFVKLEVVIETQLTRSVGNFDKFCLKCIRDKADTNTIADITRLPVKVIEERLQFLENHGFILLKDETYSLSDLGVTYFEQVNIISAFEENPLEILVDLSTGKLVYPYSLLHNVVSKTKKHPCFKININAFQFETSGEYQDNIKMQVLSLVNKLQAVDISLHPKETPFILTYSYQDIFSLPIELNQKQIHEALLKDITALEDEQSKYLSFLAPIQTEAIKVIFPEISIIKTEILNLIKLIGDANPLNYSTDLDKDTVLSLIKINMIREENGKLWLEEQGNIIYYVLLSDNRIQSIDDITIKREGFFGSVLDEKIESLPDINRNENNLNQLPQDFLFSKWKNSTNELSILPANYLIKYFFRTVVSEFGKCNAYVNLQFIIEQINSRKDKRILWGEGWSCIECGFQQSASEWNKLIKIDDYDISERAYYFCKDCEKEVELKGTRNKSGNTFVDKNGSYIKFLVKN